jgi:peptidoglycan/LPS O-acetylase OafA/YrhL
VHSVGATIERRQGRMPGLIQCRVLVVLGLIACHSFEVSDSVALLTTRPFWVLPSFFCDALFALLGFSIAQSRERHGLSAFVSARLRRTVPAYIFVILAAAFIMGPLTTSSSLRSYMSDSDLWIYLLNLVGIPQFSLPGVFDFNSLPSIVNAIVWTVPVYLVLLLTAAVMQQDRRMMLLLPFGLAFVILATCLTLQLTDHQPSTLIGFSNYVLGGQAPGTLLSGLAGVLTYRFRNRVPRGRRLATGAALLLAAIALGGNAGWLAKPLFYCLSALPVAYLSIYLCLRPLPYQAISDRLRPLLPGLYLYSFPIQQLAVAVGPRDQLGLTNLLISLPVTIAIAAVSSRFLENPLLMPHQKKQGAALAADTRQDVRKLRRSFATQMRKNFAGIVGLSLFLIIVTGVMAMLYLAMQKDAGGV